MLWWNRNPQPQLRAGVLGVRARHPLSVNEALLRPHFPEPHHLVADWYLFGHYLLFPYRVRVRDRTLARRLGLVGKTSGVGR